MSASSWYRRSLWNYKGNREYTRSGYEAAAARFSEQDLEVDCSDRHYMITGANSGIGLQTALEVARRGGIIHMVCRNQEAAAIARSEIITTTGNDKIHVHIVDLARPREVVTWSQRFAAQHEFLHVLVHNAGCMLHQKRVDEDGVEANFAVNTLAIHIITLTLMPLLQRSVDSRVVLVSSAGMLCVRLDPHDLMHDNMEPFDGRLVYSQNKRQQVVMALWYAQRYNNVHFASMHPGWADTLAVRTSLPHFYEMMKDSLRTPTQGADTVVWLAISKSALKHPSGLFYQDREPVSSHLPLAWTKSTIEEEDFLMTNIQNVYTKIYNKMFPQAADAQGAAGTTPAPSPQTVAAAAVGVSQTTTTEDLKSKEEEGAKASRKEGNENKSHSQVEETSLTTDPKKTETETPAFPVLPPPPPPAEKVTSAKSEVREIAEIHAPPATVQRSEEATGDVSKEARASQEQKTDAVEEKKDVAEGKKDVAEGKKDVAEEKKGVAEEKKGVAEEKKGVAEEKKDVTEEKKDVTEEKKDVAEEKKDTPEEKKKEQTPKENQEKTTKEKKTDTAEENKEEMKKTNTTAEDKKEELASTQQKDKERTEDSQENNEKDNTSPPPIPPPPVSDPAIPEP